MSESSYNIIMSKSEILNLSILESLSLGTRVIVNKEIKYPKELSKLIFFSKPNILSLSKKMKTLTKVNNLNYKNKKKLQKIFKRYYIFKDIDNIYKKLFIQY